MLGVCVRRHHTVPPQVPEDLFRTASGGAPQLQQRAGLNPEGEQADAHEHEVCHDEEQHQLPAAAS